MRRGVSLLSTILLALTILVVLPVWASPPRDEQIHVVQRGETLEAIARRYGITTSALIRTNGIANANWIYVGQRLTIPGTASAGASAGTTYHIVQRGENLYTIARRYGVSADALARGNGIRNSNLIYTGQRLRIAGSTSAAGSTHTVRAGETLDSVARRYGVTISALVQANGLRNPNLVYVGQRLRIPSGGSPAGPSSPAPPTSKLIEINISDQRMTVWENGRVKWYWACSTGEPGRPTAPGNWSVISKIPNAYSSVYHLQMPWWLGIYWAGSLQNGIHALPIQPNGQLLWAGFLGRRVSYGCVILDTANARALYYWADAGTPVNIHY